MKRFTAPAHQGPVKCVAAGGTWLVTGGTDDQVHLYETGDDPGARDKDLGFLVNPGQGAVTASVFHAAPGEVEPVNLVTGSQDGSIHVWHVGAGWEHMRALRGHRGAVNAISMHPTGKVALSVSQDRHLRLWDMVRGRCQYTAPLEEEAIGVDFLPGGTRYAVAAGKECVLQSVEGDVVARLALPRRVTAAAATDAAVAVGCEDGTVRLWDVRAPGGAARDPLPQGAGRTARVRGVCFPGLLDEAAAPEFLGTAHSDGRVKIFDLRMGKGGAVAEADTGARLTCMASVEPYEVALCASQSRLRAIGGEVGSGGAGGGGGEKAARKGAAREGAAREEGAPAADPARAAAALARAKGERRRAGGSGAGAGPGPGRGEAEGARKKTKLRGGIEKRLEKVGVRQDAIDSIVAEREGVWGKDMLVGAELKGSDRTRAEVKKRQKKAKKALAKARYGGQ